MGTFEELIRKNTVEAYKVVNSSAEEIDKFMDDCDQYINSIVSEIKMHILNSSEKGRISYIIEKKDTIFGNEKEKKRKPHYFSTYTFKYKINVHESIFRYTSFIEEEYAYDGCPVQGFEVNEFTVIEYLINQIVFELEVEKIYLINSEGKKINIDDIIMIINKKFQKAKKNGTNTTASVPLTFAIFL